MNEDSRLRLPPQNLEAERGVLGSLMLMPSAIDEIANLVSADDFYGDAHGKLYSAIGDMHRRGCRAIDPITLCEELVRRGELEDIGGTAYVAEIVDTVYHAAHVRYYAGIVREKSRLRQVIYLCNETMQRAYDVRETSEADELFADLDQRAMRLRDSESTSELHSIADAVDELEAYESNPGAVGKTGLHELDRMLDGGLREAQSIIVAGRPGHGKSVLVCQIARTYAERSEPAFILSLEMLKREIAGRFSKTVDRDKLRQLPIHFDDSAVVANKICSRIRYAHRRHAIKIAVLDYLQLVEPDDRKSQRERQVAEVSRSMKLLAKELRIPIVIACQLNRQSTNEKRKPRLSDLRESGSIEQDADIVLMLNEDEEGASEIIVAKQRGGECGRIPVTFDKPHSVFREHMHAASNHDYRFASDRK